MRRVWIAGWLVLGLAACASVPALEATSPDVTQRPRVGLSLKPPTYPPDAAKANLSGSTALRMCVSARGSPEKVELLTSSGHESIDRATLDWARTSLRFSPALAGNRAVRVCNHQLIWTWNIEQAPTAGAPRTGS